MDASLDLNKICNVEKATVFLGMGFDRPVTITNMPSNYVATAEFGTKKLL